eukprot:6176484-Pleurochrysis_carterae.AAC.2
MTLKNRIKKSGVCFWCQVRQKHTLAEAAEAYVQHTTEKATVAKESTAAAHMEEIQARESFVALKTLSQRLTALVAEFTKYGQTAAMSIIGRAPLLRESAQLLVAK